MRKKTIVFVLLICLVTLTIAGCSERKNTIESISIKPNAFKAVYEVDEKLNFDNIYITVTYKSGDTESVKCEYGMVMGFDTLTTGTKELYVEYKGVQSEKVSYDVVYSVDNTKEIKTTARLEYARSENNDIVHYSINYYCGDLINVNAILFTLYGEQSLNIESDLSNVSFDLITGWGYYAESFSEQALRVVLYNKDNAKGIDTNTNFVININQGGATGVASLKDIEVSTGGTSATKYYIPDYVR